MTVRPERLAARAGAATLGLGALGMAFERADLSVSVTQTDEFAAWARRHDRALTAQSAVYLASTAPLLVFLVGLSRSVAPPADRAVLAGGIAWVAFQDAAQVAQLATASGRAR